MKKKAVPDVLAALIGLVMILLLGGLSASLGLVPMSYGMRLDVANGIAILIFGILGFLYWKVLWTKK